MDEVRTEEGMPSASKAAVIRLVLRLATRWFEWRIDTSHMLRSDDGMPLGYLFCGKEVVTSSMVKAVDILRLMTGVLERTAEWITTYKIELTSDRRILNEHLYRPN
jgi:hypothetical protein